MTVVAQSLFTFTTCLRAPFKNFDGDFVLLPLYGPLTLKGWKFLVGDSNICDPAEGRVNSRTQTFSNDTSRAAALSATVPRAVEIAETCFTREDLRRDGSIHTLSCIDRIFTNLPMAELRDFQCHSHTVGTIGDKSISNDHVTAWPCPNAMRASRVGPSKTETHFPCYFLTATMFQFLILTMRRVSFADTAAASSEHAMTAVPRTGWPDGVLC